MPVSVKAVIFMHVFPPDHCCYSLFDDGHFAGAYAAVEAEDTIVIHKTFLFRRKALLTVCRDGCRGFYTKWIISYLVLDLFALLFSFFFNLNNHGKLATAKSCNF
jgi:hypothetical protein